MTCINCKYFHKVDFKTGQEKSMGECRYLPPNLMLVMPNLMLVMPNQITGSLQTTFMHPMVNYNHTCGQYCPKIAGSESGVIASSPVL